MESSWILGYLMNTVKNEVIVDPAPRTIHEFLDLIVSEFAHAPMRPALGWEMLGPLGKLKTRELQVYCFKGMREGARKKDT